MPKPPPVQPALDSDVKVLAIADLFRLAGDPTRLRIIRTLASGETHVGGLCEGLALTQPAMSHHLALMRVGGIVEPRRQGKHHFYSLTDRGRRLLSAAVNLA